VANGQLNHGGHAELDTLGFFDVLSDYAEIYFPPHLPPDGDYLHGPELGICSSEAILERSMPKLVHGACLP
jgi:hypothetical protein